MGYAVMVVPDGTFEPGVEWVMTTALDGKSGEFIVEASAANAGRVHAEAWAAARRLARPFPRQREPLRWGAN